MEKILEEVELLINNREAFNNFVYTPVSLAVLELEKRQSENILKEYLDEHISAGIPKAMVGKKNIILHRQVVTPNYETIRFVGAADALEFNPIFFEYSSDKFVTESENKYALGHLGFYNGVGKKGGVKIDHLNIIDFNKANGKKICDVKTFWGQPLMEFHHEMFSNRFSQLEQNIFDGSKWYSESGQVAKSYYKPFLLLLLKHGILFDNFMLDSKELPFTRDILLPTLIQIKNELGIKPLIVALEPTDIEGEEFWTCYPYHSINEVRKKLTVLE
jgi:hypothetical protein